MKTETYSTIALDTITLGKQSFTVEAQLFDNGHTMVWLTGARGGVYFLREFAGNDTGLRQVISWKSGQPLRVAGNEVCVYHVGNVIEVAR
jgi:hypothetical protein